MKRTSSLTHAKNIKVSLRIDGSNWLYMFQRILQVAKNAFKIQCVSGYWGFWLEHETIVLANFLVLWRISSEFQKFHEFLIVILGGYVKPNHLTKVSKLGVSISKNGDPISAIICKQIGFQRQVCHGVSRTRIG